MIEVKTFNHVTGLPRLVDLRTEGVDGKRHYALPNGKLVPSVTTLLGHFKKDVINKWRNRVGHEEAQKIANTAATRGTKLHSMIEKYLENKPVKDILHEDVSPVHKQAFYDLAPQLNRIDNIHYQEAQLYSERLFLAGRTDCIGEFDRILSVIDFKTSNRRKREDWITDYFEQSTAYAWMYEEMLGIPIKQIVIIIAVDGEPEPQVFVKRRNDYTLSLYEKITQYHIDKKTQP